MERYTKFSEFIKQYNNIKFDAANIPKIIANLEKADRDGRLKEFFINQKPYLSSFVFDGLNERGMETVGIDYVAIVLALNLYGMKNPGFVFRLNYTLKHLVKGSTKELNAVYNLRDPQLELQKLEISLIDFFDKEILLQLNSLMSKKKVQKIMLKLIFIFVGPLGAMAFITSGLAFLFPFPIFLMICGFWNLGVWFKVKSLSDEAINDCGREIREYQEEKQ